jgi:cyclopropane fatty-acyl-phospholipid synthase-like methyltransferase
VRSRSPATTLIEPFADASWKVRAHLRVRAAAAPLESVIAAALPCSDAVEIGCGHGLVAIGLARGGASAVLATDIDDERLDVARRAAARAGVADRTTFRAVGDRWHPPPASVIVIADALYLMPPDDQRELVLASAAALRPGGRLVIKETDDHPWWKATWTRWEEQLAVRTITRRTGSAIAAPSSSVLAGWMADGGLAVTVTPCGRGPWPHYLAVGSARP